jgi:AraC-like DNA-binding protein
MFSSRDADETRVFLKPFGLGFDPAGSRACSRLDVRLNGVFRSGIYIGYVRYGSPAMVRMTPDSSYAIKLPTRGRLEATSRADVVACDSRGGMLLSPTRQHVLRSDIGCARLNITFKQAALARQLAALLGAAPNAPLEFDAALNASEGQVRSLIRFLRLAAAEIDCDDSVLADAMTAGAFEQFMLTGLLLWQPHNYTDLLLRRDKLIAPRDVKRAIDYMEENLDAPIGLPEIVVASGVPGRTLLQHFRDFKGVSPLRYLRAARYERVRETLRRADPDDSITEIAARWGFSHLGRFSVEYRRRFGESPSETLRRRKVSLRAPE